MVMPSEAELKRYQDVLSAIHAREDIATFLR